MATGAIVLWAVFAGLGKLLVGYWAPSRFGETDGDVVEYLAAERTPTGKTVSLGLVLLADTVTVAVLTGVVVAGLYLAFRRWVEPLFLVACVTGETAIFTATTAVVDRQRPPVTHLDLSPPTSSFPLGAHSSGHLPVRRHRRGGWCPDPAAGLSAPAVDDRRSCTVDGCPRSALSGHALSL